MQSAFRSARQARKVAAFAPVTMVAVIPQNFEAIAPPLTLAPSPGLLTQKRPILDPVKISYGSGLHTIP